MITLMVLGTLLLVGLIFLFVMALPFLDIALAVFVIVLIIVGIVKLVRWASSR